MNEAWKHRGACLGADPDLFFPERGQATNGHYARRVCAGCPVKSECLEDALERREEHGIWGGMSERQRRAELKRRAALAGVTLKKRGLPITDAELARTVALFDEARAAGVRDVHEYVGDRLGLHPNTVRGRLATARQRQEKAS